MEHIKNWNAMSEQERISYLKEKIVLFGRNSSWSRSEIEYIRRYRLFESNNVHNSNKNI
jgi:hypothetical protein